MGVSIRTAAEFDSMFGWYHVPFRFRSYRDCPKCVFKTTSSSKVSFKMYPIDYLSEARVYDFEIKNLTDDDDKFLIHLLKREGVFNSDYGALRYKDGIVIVNATKELDGEKTTKALLEAINRFKPYTGLYISGTKIESCEDSQEKDITDEEYQEEVSANYDRNKQYYNSIYYCPTIYISPIRRVGK